MRGTRASFSSRLLPCAGAETATVADRASAARTTSGVGANEDGAGASAGTARLAGLASPEREGDEERSGRWLGQKLS